MFSNVNSNNINQQIEIDPISKVPMKDPTCELPKEISLIILESLKDDLPSKRI